MILLGRPTLDPIRRKRQMLEFVDLSLIFAVLGLSLAAPGLSQPWASRPTLPRPWISVTGTAALTLAGCMLVGLILHEPIPRVHDEFSYTLLGDTFAHGRAANPSPPPPEFFDTFHVLMRPVYASKYFPAQGAFLALGERLTGHQAAGLWLSSALASGAAVWMLQAWTGLGWALLGGILIALYYGVFSYWSQSYWGGMVAALGGALFFGAARRLWDHLSWQNAVWLALGLVIIANSRPSEGFIAVLPMLILLLWRILRTGRWKQAALWRNVVLPAGLVLLPAAAAMGMYNRAITGSLWKPPYVLHEEQYQESPQFTFLPLRPKITYSSYWVQVYYEVNEMKLYVSQRTPRNLLLAGAMKFAEWWEFYCGILLSAPLVLPALLQRRTRCWQIALLTGFILAAMFFDPRSELLRFTIDLLAFAQIGLLWSVFDGFWPWLALGTSILIIFESWFVKWSRPHYFAPAACLVLFLQVDGLRRIWNWEPEKGSAEMTRTERRRITRANAKSQPRILPWKSFVFLLPFACAVALAIQVMGRLNNWWSDEGGPTHHVLMLDDWSVRRADLEHWLQQQPSLQLVFVRYSPNHNVNFEWVYNHADIMHSHVMWARDLGSEHNKLLLNLVPDRNVWLLEADARNPQLVPYPDWSGPSANAASVAQTAPSTDDIQLNW